jgi:sulfoxide reductase heme-binding subunit YedZ
MIKFFNSPYLFWAILLVPSLPMLGGFLSEPENAGRLLHPSGEFAARFMIIAMLISPLRLLFPGARWLVWLMRRRRHLGVAAFGYAVLHTLFYVVDKGGLAPMLDEFWEVGIWTGWVAFIIFVPLALTSNDVSQRWLLGRWKQLQRFVYGVAVLTLVHWIFVENNVGPALVHFLPLAALEAFRIWKNLSGASRPREAT